MVKTTVTATIVTLLMAVEAMALGYKVEIDTQNDKFENKGTITGTQTTMGGVSSQIVAQRARAPQVDLGSLKYTSRNNTYVNTGDIKATQTTIAGGATQTVAQESY